MSEIGLTLTQTDEKKLSTVPFMTILFMQKAVMTAFMRIRVTMLFMPGTAMIIFNALPATIMLTAAMVMTAFPEVAEMIILLAEKEMILHGTSGDDTYVWNLGDGFDSIGDSSGTDVIQFGAGVTFDDLSFRGEGNNLLIFVKGDETQGMSISDFFYSSSNHIEYLKFADGSDVRLDEIGLTLIQTDAKDNIKGTKYDDVVYLNGGG